MTLDPSLYDPTVFWQTPPPGAFGPWDPSHPDDSPLHVAQEATILDVLGAARPSSAIAAIDASALAGTAADLPSPQLRGFVPSSIFEAGCGYGRLARFFKRQFPDASYVAIDLGSEQLASARAFQPAGHFIHGDFLSYGDEGQLGSLPNGEPDPDALGSDYDLVVASEVLMHIRPEDLGDAAARLLGLAEPSVGYVLTADWVPLEGELERLAATTGIAPWNFPHDYLGTFHRLGAKLVRASRTNRQMVFLWRPS